MPPTLEAPQTIRRREIHPEVKIIDASKGLVDYVASDETIDAYQEIVAVKGWKFTNFSKNAPFVDSHNYSGIASLLGRVVDFNIMGGKLVERVQWAKDIPNTLAEWGFKMLEGGFLKAVSVGFWPTDYVTSWQDTKRFAEACKNMGLSVDDAAKVKTIYLEQEQVELSACIIGANPNALAKAYAAKCLSEQDLDGISRQYARIKSQASPSDVLGGDGLAQHRELLKAEMLLRIQNCLSAA